MEYTNKAAYFVLSFVFSVVMLHFVKPLEVNGFSGDIAGCLASAQEAVVALLAATELVFDVVVSIKP